MLVTSDAVLLDAIDQCFGHSPETPLGVAVSGGSDSLALLHLLADWGQAPLHVITVDHGLRPEAKAEACYVSSVCEALGIEHETLHWSWQGQGNLQDQARRGRYGVMASWAASEGIGQIALGHTMDDVAETFLMRLSREAGLDGLSAMARWFDQQGMRFVRPLLDISRVDLQAYLRRRDVTWVSDPSNEDPRFGRVRARAVLQALEPLGITPKGLARSAGNLRATRELVDGITSEAARDMIDVDRGDIIIDDTRAVAELGSEIARRLMQISLMWVSGSDYAPRRETLIKLTSDALLGLTCTGHGCLISSQGEGVRIAREYNAAKDVSCPSDALWDGRWRLQGPHGAGYEIRALGEKGLKYCENWREANLPRASLLASPSVWQGPDFIAAPLAQTGSDWTAHLLRDAKDLHCSVYSH
jgi:tRNA(Ile)-lysidine synthase